MNQPAIDLIKKWEGLRLEPYLCSGGKWTIGYGHTAGVDENTPAISEEEAEALLYEDIQAAERAIARHVKVTLNENQKAALISFVFNLGESQFRNSTLLRVLNEGRAMQCVAEFGRWIYAGDKPLKGLQMRRYEEATLFCTPQKGDHHVG